MHRREAVVSLLSLCGVPCLPAGRLLAEVSGSGGVRKFVAHGPHQRQEAVRVLSECAVLCGRLAGCSSVADADGNRAVWHSLDETEQLCRTGIETLRNSPHTAPAFWQACGDACHRSAENCRRVCTVNDGDVETLRHAGDLCLRMVVGRSDSGHVIG